MKYWEQLPKKGLALDKMHLAEVMSQLRKKKARWRNSPF
jgi:hypothetical protein